MSRAERTKQYSKLATTTLAGSPNVPVIITTYLVGKDTVSESGRKLTPRLVESSRWWWSFNSSPLHAIHTQSQGPFLEQDLEDIHIHSTFQGSTLYWLYRDCVLHTRWCWKEAVNPSWSPMYTNYTFPLLEHDTMISPSLPSHMGIITTHSTRVNGGTSYKQIKLRIFTVGLLFRSKLRRMNKFATGQHCCSR